MFTSCCCSGQLVHAITTSKPTTLRQQWSSEGLLDLACGNIFTSSLLINYAKLRGIELVSIIRELKEAAATVSTTGWAPSMVEHVRELMKLSTIKKLDMNYVGFFCCTLGLMDMLESHQMVRRCLGALRTAHAVAHILIVGGVHVQD